MIMNPIDYQIIIIYCLVFFILLLCLLELSTRECSCDYRNIIREGSLFARLIRTNIANNEIINNPQLDNIQHISPQNINIDV